VFVYVHVANAAAAVAGFPNRATPVHRLDGGPRPVGIDVTDALGAHNVVADIRDAAVLLAAAAKQFSAVGIFINDEMVIENLAIGGIGPHLTAADAAGFDRVLVTHHPSHLVEDVNVLLDVMISLESGEIE